MIRGIHALVALALAAALPGAAEEALPEALADAAFHEKVRATARAAFVTVHVTFRKDPAELEDATPYRAMAESRGPEDLARELAHRFVDDRRTLDLPGLWLDAEGTVLVTDLGLPVKYIERIAVRTGDGRKLTAGPKAVLRDAPGWLLKVETPGPFPAPAFADPGVVLPLTEFTTVWTEEIDGVWSMAVGLLGRATIPLSGAAGPSWLLLGDGSAGALHPPSPWLDAADASGLTGRPLHLLFNDAAVPVGVALHDRLPLDPARPAAWRGPAVQRGPAVTFDALRDLERRLVTAADRHVAEIKLTFRMDARDDEREFDPWSESVYLRSPFEGGVGGRERTVYGIAVAPRRLLVPLEMNEATAARIERIDVSLPGVAASVPGRFLGAFKAFAGYVVETETDLAAPPPDLHAVESFPEVRPIPTLRVIRKYGQRTPVFGYARILERRRGYKHRLVDVPDPPQAPGTFLFDLDGRPAGFVARLRRDDEKVRALRDPDRGGYRSPWESGMHAEDNRLYRFRDLRRILADPEAAFDPDIRVKTKFEQRRLVWLGVEYCLLNRELTRQLGIEGPTKSGQVGVMVVDVYDDSPATRLGLRDGDILLQVRDRGAPEPVEFRFHDDGFGRLGMRFPAMPPSESEEELWLAEPPWHSQRNPLNLLLTTIGRGKTVRLTWLSDGRAVEKELVLEEGPPDYEGTKRQKHEPTGLTVRDLTYEVRKALKLPKAAPGVVISRVEEGSPAAVAKINRYDVIQRVDGKTVDGAEGLVRVLEATRTAGTDSVKVQILRLNRNRFVDLRFEAPPDARRPAAPPGKR